MSTLVLTVAQTIKKQEEMLFVRGASVLLSSPFLVCARY